MGAGQHPEEREPEHQRLGLRMEGTATIKVLSKVNVLIRLRSRWFFTFFQYVELCWVILSFHSLRVYTKQRFTFTVNTFQPGCWPQLLMNDSGAHFDV